MPAVSSDSIRLRFFDLAMHKTSDSPAYTDLFKQMYARFQGNDTSANNALTVSIRAFPAGSARQAIFEINDQSFPIDRSEVVEGYVYEQILREIVARIESHLLIHAGAVSTNGRGVILAGDSCHGKTTLVLELVRRGFCFLSDETAALGRSDHFVHPFPRSLRIRPQTLALTRLTAAAQSAKTWLDKLILDIEEIKPRCMGHAVPISHIILLKNETDGEDDLTLPVTKTFVLNRLDNSLILSLRGIDEIVSLYHTSDDNRHFLHVTATQIHTVDTRVRQACKQFNARIIDAFGPSPKKPDFRATATLVPISKSQAVRELLKKFQGGYQSALLKNACRGNAIKLFTEAIRIVADAECFQLQVGTLADMADLVCEICEHRTMELKDIA